MIPLETMTHEDIITISTDDIVGYDTDDISTIISEHEKEKSRKITTLGVVRSQYADVKLEILKLERNKKDLEIRKQQLYKSIQTENEMIEQVNITLSIINKIFWNKKGK